jgi:hypothetical protein
MHRLVLSFAVQATGLWVIQRHCYHVALQLLSCRSALTDDYLRVKGGDGSIWAFGDASTIDQPRALQRADDLFEQADTNKVRSRPNFSAEHNMRLEPLHQALCSNHQSGLQDVVRQCMVALSVGFRRNLSWTWLALWCALLQGYLVV